MNLLSDHLHDFVSLFFPRLCASCGQSLSIGEEVICSYCQFRLPKTAYHLERHNAMEKHFWGRVEIFRASSYFYFQKGSHVQHLIHQLKYRGRTEVGVKLGKMYGSELLACDDYKSVDVILPVPLHKSKEMQRGYNQVLVFPFSTLEKRLKMRIPNSPAQLKTIGDHLRKKRVELRLSQSFVAKKLGTKGAVLSIWELNVRTPHVRYFPKIIEFLGYNPISKATGSLSNKIFHYRITHGLSRAAFAKLCGIDTSNIYRLEHHMKPTIKSKQKVTAVLTAASS